MRIAVDAVTPGASLDSRAGGMRMTLTNLIGNMSLQQPSVEFVVLESRRFALTALDAFPNVTRIACPGIPIGRAARIIYQNSVLPLLLRTINVDVLLATCNVLPLGCPVPSVVIVQSLQYFDHPEAYGRLRGAYLRTAVRYACRHAKSVICVSEVARSEVIRLTGLSAAKVRVVHHGISPEISTYSGGKRATASPPYILCVATLYRYKNLSRLLQAFAQLKTGSGIPHRLRIIGGEADVTVSELALEARHLGVGAEVDFVGRLPHSELAPEYASASVLVYPSLYETFGYPPLEAMALGVPVVASKASSMLEIVGGAGELVDPLDVTDIARGLASVLLDSRRAQTLVAMGFKRAAEFSWEASARGTLEAIQSVVAKPIHGK